MVGSDSRVDTRLLDVRISLLLGALCVVRHAHGARVLGTRSIHTDAEDACGYVWKGCIMQVVMCEIQNDVLYHASGYV